MTREAVKNILDSLLSRKEERYAHLLEKDGWDKEYNMPDTMPSPKSLYEQNTTLDEDCEDTVCGVLELYYCYRPETTAQKDSLLAAATYAVINRLQRHKNCTQKMVADEFEVSVSVISAHNLDMLDSRFPEEGKESNENVRRLIKELRNPENGDLEDIA